MDRTQLLWVSSSFTLLSRFPSFDILFPWKSFLSPPPFPVSIFSTLPARAFSISNSRQPNNLFDYSSLTMRCCCTPPDPTDPDDDDDDGGLFVFLHFTALLRRRRRRRRCGHHFITNLHQQLRAETTCFPAILHPPGRGGGRQPIPIDGPAADVVGSSRVGVRMSCMEPRRHQQSRPQLAVRAHTHIHLPSVVSLELNSAEQGAGPASSSSSSGEKAVSVA